ncbi:MAG: hypothetical protein JXP34_19900 [Planctomycetes bacterium]|nr:hypothetical protein [Planctomycetota bacterium]
MTEQKNELTPELKDKIHRILGIPAEELDDYSPFDLIDELSETVFLLDGQEVLFKINTLKGKLHAIENRMRTLMGVKESKRVKDANVIADLERFVGDLKRRAAELDEEHTEDERLLKDSIQLYEQQESMIAELTQRVHELEAELAQLKGD